MESRELMTQQGLEYVRELAKSIHEIKINTEISVTKLDQLRDDLAKLEESVEDIHMSLSEKDRRLTILEQKIPSDLVKDLTLLKQSQKSFSKGLWLIGGGTLTALIQISIEMLSK